MQRSSNPQLDEILGKEYPCLDHGFVRLIDYMGSDEAIVQAARVSYGKGTKKLQQDRDLIRYLMRHQHTSPFEMVEFKFHCKLPIFVARQWIRHRMASVNEYSLRYSQARDEFYFPAPEMIRRQSTTNRQGRSEESIPEELQQQVLETMRKHIEQLWQDYERFQQMDIARELARIQLPVSLYTEWYWKIDLHNLLHFLKLRLDPAAQYEIQVYARAIAEIVKIAVPLTWEAFEDYVLEARSFSRQELALVRQVLDQIASSINWESLAENRGLTKREIQEFIEKIGANKP
ncbi:MAG: FAD-dependent thymidylate synthase [candidate division KSB1 bacterium]|nr:FAD-dependent thymidylate synthase [candidate division KSB1 bacterium]MDZ7335117.1 FAD-dependent thymidylate synthase [candidate division KSB1 bacterium]MDZ7356612.1 FAD-dependent thymidylate synthase [candidate division KSB1 bacterium]MDZ7398966.1 FAD-dependent thymidylate synthase [candidate division KSB1 bacterium]